MRGAKDIQEILHNPNEPPRSGRKQSIAQKPSATAQLSRVDSKPPYVTSAHSLNTTSGSIFRKSLTGNDPRYGPPRYAADSIMDTSSCGDESEHYSRSTTFSSSKYFDKRPSNYDLPNANDPTNSYQYSATTHSATASESSSSARQSLVDTQENSRAVDTRKFYTSKLTSSGHGATTAGGTLVKTGNNSTRGNSTTAKAVRKGKKIGVGFGGLESMKKKMEGVKQLTWQGETVVIDDDDQTVSKAPVSQTRQRRRRSSLMDDLNNYEDDYFDPTQEQHNLITAFPSNESAAKNVIKSDLTSVSLDTQQQPPVKKKRFEKLKCKTVDILNLDEVWDQPLLSADINAWNSPKNTTFQLFSIVWPNETKDGAKMDVGPIWTYDNERGEQKLFSHVVFKQKFVLFFIKRKLVCALTNITNMRYSLEMRTLGIHIACEAVDRAEDPFKQFVEQSKWPNTIEIHVKDPGIDVTREKIKLCGREIDVEPTINSSYPASGISTRTRRATTNIVYSKNGVSSGDEDFTEVPLAKFSRLRSSVRPKLINRRNSEPVEPIVVEINDSSDADEPETNQVQQQEFSRRTTRNSSRLHINGSAVLFCYPANGINAVTIIRDDLERLNEGEFLNDNIIDFYLRFILNEQISPNTFNRTFVYSSFFYRKLTTRTHTQTVGKSIQAQFERVKKWTSKVDIFEKDFLIIPINEHAHWYLAIIMYPGRLLKAAQRSDDKMDVDNNQIIILEDDNGSTISSAKKKDEESFNTKTTIAICDSLGHARQHAITHLKNYLISMTKDRLNLPEDYDEKPLKEVMKGLNAKLPLQPNHCDCGVYLLHYSELFLKDPDTFAKKIAMKDDETRNWFDAHDILTKRVLLRSLFIKLHDTYVVETSTARVLKEETIGNDENKESNSSEDHTSKINVTSVEENPEELKENEESSSTAKSIISSLTNFFK